MTIGQIKNDALRRTMIVVVGPFAFVGVVIVGMLIGICDAVGEFSSAVRRGWRGRA